MGACRALTYTNYLLCTGDDSKRFEISLYGHTSDFHEDPKDGTMYVDMYASNGVKVAEWYAGFGSSHSFTKYWSPIYGSNYYYFKIRVDIEGGYSWGSMCITAVDK